MLSMAFSWSTHWTIAFYSMELSRLDILIEMSMLSPLDLPSVSGACSL